MRTFRVLPALVLWLLATTAAVFVVVACVTLIRQRSLDYDEIEHAHAAWLVAQGSVPYHDFFEVHLPFAWLALSTFAHGVSDADALVLRLRAISAIGHALTVLLLCANMRLGRRDIHPLWIAVALLTMLTSEGNLDYLIEVRPDCWANAALLGAMLLARTKRYAAFGFLSMASQLWAPKLVVLAGSFAALELIFIAKESRRDALRAAAWMAGGAAAALTLALLVLRAAGIDPELAYRLGLGYHALLGLRGGFGYGLAQTIFDQRAISGPAAIGFILWAIAIARRELRPNTFELAMALFLIAQLCLVPFPYKQYFAPWLLLAAVFIPFWSTLAGRIAALRAIALPAAVLAVFFAALFAMIQARYTRGFPRDSDYWRFIARHAGPHARIVAHVPAHPITARDALYAWVGTTGRNPRYGPETIMRELRLPGISERLTFAHYLRELEAARPRVIVPYEPFDAAFPQRQAAIERYLRTHANDYERKVVERQVVYVRRSLARISLSLSP